jgi:ferredoxin-NADP reductase/ferredoxin
MMEDIKKYQKAEKLKKRREESFPIPWYYDGLKDLVDRIHPETQVLRLVEIEPLNYDTKLYRFVSAKMDQPLAPFRAGQYIGLTVNINGIRTSRPYSLVSSPNQIAFYELAIRKKIDGFVSPYLFENAKKGDIFEATEPLGDLYYNRIFHGSNLVFIAGGCGITPFISMLKDFYEKDIPKNIWLIYGCVTEKDIIFRDFLDKIKEKRSDINVDIVLSEPEKEWGGACGFITKDIISKSVPSPEKEYFYIVGNQPMYQFIEAELNKLLIPKHRTLYEAFGVPDDITQVIGWPIDIQKSEKVNIKIDYINNDGSRNSISFEASCIEPILNSIEMQSDLKISIKNGCRSGHCAFCRTKIISGDVFIPPKITIREVDKDFGFIHPCVSYPLTNIHLDLTQT